MKKQLLLLLTFCISLAAVAQVSSTDGTFSAAGTTNLGLRTNTTTRLTILGSGASAGFVGVNTAAPADWFHVNGNVRANQFNSVSGILNTIGTVNLSFRTNNTARMTILGATSGSRLAGFVGLNTITPDDWFHVNGNIRANQFNSVSGVLNTIGATNLSFRTNNTARMTINGTSGNVGIGTDNSLNRLQIGPNLLGWGDVTGGNDLVVTNSNGGLAINTSGTDTYLWGSTDISIRPGNTGTSSIYAKSDGNVGIGTTTPAYKLDVNGTLNATSILVNGQPISGGTSSWASDGVNTYIPSGNIGIGTTTPGAKLSFSDLTSDNTDGITWYNPEPTRYGIFRSAGAWSAPDYQQLQLSWDTGIILNPGNSYGKSFVDVQGSGLKISSGNLDVAAKAHFGGYSQGGSLTGAASANAYSLEVGGANPDGVSGDATIFFHHHGVLGHQLRYNNGNLFLEAAGNGYGTNPTPNFLVGGKVGIGTTTPITNLDVNGVIGINGIPVINTGASAGNDIYLNSRVIRNESTTNLDGMYVNYNSTGSTEAHLRLYANGAAERMRIDANTGYVGIGTPTPAYNLDVAGTINATSILVGGQPISGGSSSWANIGTDINFLTGNVGIGRAPVAGNKLDVNGAVNASSYKISGTTLVSSQWATSGTNLFYNSANNVGIGTGTASTLASAKLNVYKSAAATSVLIGSPTTTSGNFTSLVLGTSADKDGFTFINSTKSAAASPVLGDLVLNQNGGNVGIGKTPGSANKLDVNGTINATGILVNGVDVAAGSSIWSRTTGNTIVAQGIAGSFTLDLRTSAAGNSILSLSSNTGGSAIIKASKYGTEAKPLVFQTNDTEQMRIDGNGITTVGTVGSNTNSKFQVNYASGGIGYGASIKNSLGANGYGMADLTFYNDIDSRSTLFLTNSGYSNSTVSTSIVANTTGIMSYGNGGIAFVSKDANASMRFATNNTTKMTIDATGNMGIGKTPAAGYKLDVDGTINAKGFLVDGVDLAAGSSIWARTGNSIVAQGNSAGSFTLRLQTATAGDAILLLSSSTGGRAVIKANKYGTEARPLIFQTNDVEQMRIDGLGNVGIGTANPTQKLTVKGTVYSTEVKVDLSAGAPDYVFEKEYNLPTLDSIKAYIDKNKHLPEVPSAKEMEKNGVNLGEMNMLLLKKIEELTLHVIAQNKKLDEMKKENEAQNEVIKSLVEKNKK